MIDYVRPPVVVEEFLDDDGQVIPYGSRWEDMDQDGPENTYSVTKHPQRFQPLTDVAHAIAEHLLAMYDVQREDPDEQTIVLRPSDPAAAPLTFEFDPFPWAHVTAGVSTSIAWFCECDHCDEDLIVAIEQMEDEISAVVDGGLREWLNDPANNYTGDDLFQAYALRSVDGEINFSGSSGVDDAYRRHDLRELYAGVPAAWAPWTLRSR